MRISSAALLLALAACGRPAEAPQNLQQTRPIDAQAVPAEHIACARGTAPLTPDCTLDRETTARGQIWTIRHPDGSFRRLIVQGGEIETADGAELLRPDGDTAVIGDERYLFPPR